MVLTPLQHGISEHCARGFKFRFAGGDVAAGGLQGMGGRHRWTLHRAYQGCSVVAPRVSRASRTMNFWRGLRGIECLWAGGDGIPELDLSLFTLDGLLPGVCKSRAVGGLPVLLTEALTLTG